MYATPYVSPAELRPGRGWYVFAALFAALLIVLGVGGFAWGVITAVRSSHLGVRFESGQPVQAAMSPSPRRAIYVRLAYPQAETPQATCTVTGPPGPPPSVSPPTGTFTTTLNGVSWRELYVVNATESGTHFVTCTSDQPLTFAIGDHVTISTFVGGLLGGIAALFVLPGLGILVGVITAVVVAVKRGNHRRFLYAQRYPPRY